MSMDLTSYYHQIDPAFIADTRFLKEIGVDLSPWELAFTKSLAHSLLQWGQKAKEQIRSLGGLTDDSYVGGLPISLSAARLIANVLLFGLDRDIEQSLVPIFYGRYVDDIFLVLRDPGNIGNATSLISYISSRTKSFPPAPDSSGRIYLTLDGGYQGQTKLVLQQEKQKAFFLQGRSGLDLLDNIESEIRSVSSERRLMPSPEHLESMASARILTAAGSPSEEADTLRRADGLAVRRLGWSIQLRAVETLARDIPAREWKKERARFYEFAHNHILRPDKILDHIDYLPRLLSLAVALTDWTEARRLVDAARSAIQKLKARTVTQPIRLNGIEIGEARPDVWRALDSVVCELAREAIVRSLRWRSSDGTPFPLTETAVELCEMVGLGSDEVAIHGIALDFREADLAKTPYKDHLRRDAYRKRPTTPYETNLYGLYVHEADLRQFLQLSNKAAELSAARVNARCQNQALEGITSSLLPFLFPTRPYSTQEISLYVPTCIFGSDGRPAKQWARYTRAVRGIWVWSSLADDEAPDRNDGNDEPPSRDVVYLGSPRHPQTVLLGISSLLTTQDSWSAGASGSPDTSPQRYERIKTLVNQAINAKPRPTHLLLPEHALPERWINTISGLLHDAGISLIAGLDYHVHGTSQIHSAAVLVLTDDRLGYPAAVQIRQPKVLPAPKEEEELLKLFGRTWPHDLPKEKPVYVHGGFSFGVLVCSELQNVSYRSNFQGNVDCMVVLSWNQDLETFGALVEAASLDVHAHIALVNNRMFGDSRVRSPAKKHHDRDLCRIRGGKNEHIVVVELEIDGLRAFQSRAKRWPNDADLYKPVPEGFSLSPRRRVIPS
ncbi:RNA-directed DNA polymerase [Bradyrhizobium sp. USDA 3240]